MKWMVLINILVIINHDVFAVGSESHSLVFLSTGRTKSHAGPSFEQLTVFDGTTISYCESSTRREQLKPVLQSASLPERCNEAHENILESINRIQQTVNFTVDVMQRRRGCSLLANNTVSGFEAWAVNGVEFLVFDPETLKWTSKITSAAGVEQLWSSETAQGRSHAFSGFIRIFCPKLIPQITIKPITKSTELRVFGKLIENSDTAQLRCHVTTTDKSVKSVRLIGDGASSVIYVSVMGPVPSGDGSVVLRLRAGISLRHSGLSYGCIVHTEDHNITVYWNGNTIDGRYIYHVYMYKTLTAVIGCIAIIGLVVVIGLAMVVFYTCFKMRRRSPPPLRPELRDLFERLIQIPTLNPVTKSILLSYLYGTNVPERYQNTIEEWLEMVESNNCCDPEFHGGHV